MWDNRFEEIVRRYLPLLSADEVLEEDLDLREYGLDSLSTVELLSELEHTYEFQFAEEALTLETFRTPGVLWRALSAMREPVS
jgi:acyl carrier protein